MVLSLQKVVSLSDIQDTNLVKVLLDNNKVTTAKKDLLRVADEVVWHPEGSYINKNLKSYYSIRKSEIRKRKFKGVSSEGLAVPVSIFKSADGIDTLQSWNLDSKLQISTTERYKEPIRPAYTSSNSYSSLFTATTSAPYPDSAFLDIIRGQRKVRHTQFAEKVPELMSNFQLLPRQIFPLIVGEYKDSTKCYIEYDELLKKTVIRNTVYNFPEIDGFFSKAVSSSIEFKILSDLINSKPDYHNYIYVCAVKFAANGGGPTVDCSVRVMYVINRSTNRSPHAITFPFFGISEENKKILFKDKLYYITNMSEYLALITKKTPTFDVSLLKNWEKEVGTVMYSLPYVIANIEVNSGGVPDEFRYKYIWAVPVKNPSYGVSVICD